MIRRFQHICLFFAVKASTYNPRHNTFVSLQGFRTGLILRK